MDEMTAHSMRVELRIHKGPAYAENGTFLWVIDPGGNKVELGTQNLVTKTYRSDLSFINML
jgi:hypothetical protein